MYFIVELLTALFFDLVDISTLSGNGHRTSIRNDDGCLEVLIVDLHLIGNIILISFFSGLKIRDQLSEFSIQLFQYLFFHLAFLQK